MCGSRESRQKTSKFVRVIRMFFTVSVLICFFSLVQTNVIHQRENSLGGSISSRQRKQLKRCRCNDQGEPCEWSKLTRQDEFSSEQRSSLLNRDKSGTLGPKRDKLASRETSDFFPGLEVKNRDCPGQSGTDGHLRQFCSPNNSFSAPAKYVGSGAL